MNCIFCEIINGNIPAKIVSENEKAIAFLDVRPLADGHTIVMPKKHYKNLSETPVEDLKAVFELVQEVSLVLSKTKLKPWGFNYLSNEGSIAGQEIFHFHVHIIPKYAKNEGYKSAVGNIVTDDVELVFDKIKKSKWYKC